ncbi:MAG: nicotinamide riboside transporter PnuC [Bacteroidales bacterium]|nr:nicotinamide riboside transporter PnuC [Bacteroidales bacterium]MCL2132863.1 nicotinamide riboside transporter PnuC [Bacteroidales bacterium]
MLSELTIEIIGAIFALFYLFLEIKQKRMMWVVGFISSAFYVYIFFQAKFYAYMGLYSYYILASVYGWVLWSKQRLLPASQTRSRNDGQLTVSSLFFNKSTNQQITHKSSFINHKLITFLLLISALLFALFTFILRAYTDSSAPVGEALATALSIVATWMLAKKILEQWWVWLFVNLLTMALALQQGLYPTAILFCCYAAASVVGYYKWKKDVQRTA